MKAQTIKILTRLWIVFFTIGGVALIAKFITGERLAGYGSYVPWGLWVAIYFHAIGIGGGAFAIGVAGYFFNIRGMREHIRVICIVAGGSVMTGLLAIWLDLGQPWRFYRVLLSPNFGSMMAFNGWMYSVFLAVLALIFALSMKRTKQTDLNDPKGWLVPLLALGFMLSLMYPSQSGAFFGVVDAKPYWNSALLPVMFLASAITSGAAVLLLVFTFLVEETTHLTQQPLRMLRWTVFTGVLFYFVAEFAEYSLVFWSPNSHNREAVELVLFGPFWWVFWLVHLGGGLLGLYLLVRRQSLPMVGTGAFVVAVTFLTARLNILIPGQAVSELRGLRDAFHHERLRFDYVATWNEYLIALFIGAFGVGLIYGAVHILSRYTKKKIGASL